MFKYILQTLHLLFKIFMISQKKKNEDLLYYLMTRIQNFFETLNIHRDLPKVIVHLI